MKEIQLSRGMVALVDDEDFEYLSQWKWFYYRKPDRNTGYAIREVRHQNSSRSLIRMHRQIMEAQKGQIIDHKNGNGLDNRKENLRFCTDNENKYNSKKRKHNTSGYKGVFYDKRGIKHWSARIKINNKTINLGYFETSERAALAYNEAALKYHGEFARINKGIIL